MKMETTITKHMIQMVTFRMLETEYSGLEGVYVCVREHHACWCPGS